MFDKHVYSENLYYWSVPRWTHWAKGWSCEHFKGNAKSQAQQWLQYLWKGRPPHTSANSRIFFLAWQQKELTALAVKTLKDNKQTQRMTSKSWLRNQVMKTFAFQHPIIFENYNICEIVCHSKLSKFSIGMLQEICTELEVDISSITSKRKQPYMDILQR